MLTLWNEKQLVLLNCCFITAFVACTFPGVAGAEAMPDGVHYVIGYDRSGSMRKHREIESVSNQVKEYLDKNWKDGDIATIALLGLTQKEYAQLNPLSFKKNFLDNFCIIPLFKNATFFTDTLNIKEALGDVASSVVQNREDRRQISYTGIHLHALMLVAASKQKGRALRIIWITDQEPNDRTAANEQNGLKTRIGEENWKKFEVLDAYYRKTETVVSSNGIKIKAIDVSPTALDQVKLTVSRKNGVPVDGISETRSLFSNTFSGKWKGKISFDDKSLSLIQVDYNFRDKTYQSSADENIEIDLDSILIKERGLPIITGSLLFHVHFKDNNGVSYVWNGKVPLTITKIHTPEILIGIFFLLVIFTMVLLWREKKAQEQLDEEYNKTYELTNPKSLPLAVSIDTLENSSTQNNRTPTKGVLNFTASENIVGLENSDVEATITIVGQAVGDTDTSVKPVTLSFSPDNNQPNVTMRFAQTETSFTTDFWVRDYYNPKEVTINVRLTGVVSDGHSRRYRNPEDLTCTFILKPNPAESVWTSQFLAMGSKSGNAEIPNILVSEKSATLLGTLSFFKDSKIVPIKEVNQKISDEKLILLIESFELIDEDGKKNEDDRYKPYFESGTSSLYLPLFPNEFGESNVRINYKAQLTNNEITLHENGKLKEITLKLLPDYGDLYLAVDFGTSETVAIFGTPDGPRFKHSLVSWGTPTLSSRIYVGGDDSNIQWLFEDEGKNIPKVNLGGTLSQVPKYPDRLFLSFKKLVGKEDFITIIDNRINIEEVLVGIFQEIYRQLELHRENHFRSDKIRRICVTVPNAYTPHKVELVRNAWSRVRLYDKTTNKISSLRVFNKRNIHVVREAEAVACFYADNVLKTESNLNQDVLIYDLGAGTLDIALVNIQKNNKDKDVSQFQLNILKRYGYSLGSDWMDAAIAYAISSIATLEYLFDPTRAFIDRKKRMDMKTIAKRVKEEYSNNEDFSTAYGQIDTTKINRDQLPFTADAPNGKLDCLIQSYFKKIIEEPLNDLWPETQSTETQSTNQKSVVVICSGRGIQFRNLKTTLFTEFSSRKITTESYDLESLSFNDWSASQLLKNCVAYGALLYSRKRNEFEIIHHKVYGTFFSFDSKDKPLPLLLDGAELIEDNGIPGRYTASGKGTCKFYDRKCQIFHGQGCNPLEDYNQGKIHRYDLVETVACDKGLHNIEIIVDSDDNIKVKLDNQLYSNKSVIRDFFLKLSDTNPEEQTLLYWPY